VLPSVRHHLNWCLQPDATLSLLSLRGNSNFTSPTRAAGYQRSSSPHLSALKLAFEFHYSRSKLLAEPVAEPTAALNAATQCTADMVMAATGFSVVDSPAESGFRRGRSKADEVTTYRRPP
jgi:hypothetical protein